MTSTMDVTRINRLTRELWGNVLDHLDNPQDRLNFIEAAASRNLNRTFAEKKRGWLFAATLPIIMKQAEQWNRNRILACQQAFMKCRLVSRDCFNAVDKYIEDYWDRGWDDTFPLRMNDFITVLPQYKTLLTNQNVYSFFDKIKHHSLQTCPIVTKELTFFHTIFFSISWLLERIGPLLRSVGVSLNYLTEVEFVQFMEKHLPLIENVKSITIVFHPVSPRRNRNPLRRQAQHELIQNQINQPVPVLPKLPHLTNLFIQMRSGYHLQFNTHLQTYFSQLQILTLDLCLWKNEFNGSFPNLKKLMLNTVNVHNEEMITSLIDLFRNLTAPQLQLVRLSKLLYVCYSERIKWNFLKEMGLFFLSRNYPAKQWQGVISGEYESTITLFDPKQITVKKMQHELGWDEPLRRRVYFDL